MPKPSFWKVAVAATILAAIAPPSWEQTRDTPLTVERCRADARLYEKDDAVDRPTAESLQHQADEIRECETKIDKTNWQRYHVLVDKFLIAISLREKNFISRHNLWAQFAAEDEAGMR